MSSRTARIAPALLAMLFAGLALTAARAEPSAGSADSCLAKPNAATPAGSHWYYRVEHATGRHCWYLRAQVGAAEAKADQGERAATRSVAAPTSRSAAEAPDQTAGSSNNSQFAGQTAVPPPSAPAAAPPRAPAEWPSVPASSQIPSQAPSQDAAPSTRDAAPITNDNVADQTPAAQTIDRPAEAQAPDSNSRSAPPIVVQAPAAERPVTSTTDPGHLPALLGTALVLVFIVLGSVGAHFAGRFLQRRRLRRIVRDGASWDVAGSGAPRAGTADVAAVTPAMRRVRPNEWESDQHADLREAALVAEPGPQREAAQVLESSVRELLHRLQSDLKSKSSRSGDVATAAASRPRPVLGPPPPAAAAGDLEAALAIWAGKKARR